MHVVKNVAESLTSTLFNIKGKTKDTWKSRKDLMDTGLKKSLHLVEDGNSFIMPMACYHFTKDEKQKFLNFLASIKFPDGFASNISRCVKEGELQLSRMKSHDFYVFIQKLLPLSIRGSLTKEARVVLYELSDFIQFLCARNMYIDVLEKQEEKIALIMCKLERMFPPSFFNIMTHLLIHLPFEAKKGGPFQYRWMFPFERKMRTLQGYVERNNEMVDIDGDISVFSCKGRPLGSKITRDISNIELEKIHTYILNNCDEMVELINEHKLKLKKENCNNINELHDKHFASWLKRVNICPESFESEIRLLSRGPFLVNEFSGCMVNGFKFHTQSRETNRKTQHMGDVYKKKEPQLNLNVDLNLEQSSLRRGSTLLELVDAITFSGDSTGISSKNRLFIDEEYIDDEETDSSDLEYSDKEGSSQEDESSQEEYIDSD
ncbi:hypothetical protein Tco_1010170 [Tanacetum coccineum]